jgi:hypothetical protein
MNTGNVVLTSLPIEQLPRSRQFCFEGAYGGHYDMNFLYRNIAEENIHKLYSAPYITVIVSRRIRWALNIARMGDMGN